MGTAKKLPDPPPCPSRTPEAEAAFAALRANPTPETALAVKDALYRRCDVCGDDCCPSVVEANALYYAWCAEDQGPTPWVDNLEHQLLMQAMFGGR
jgi:hypothetical protein